MPPPSQAPRARAASAPPGASSFNALSPSAEITHVAPAIAAKKNGVTVIWASSALAVNAAVASAIAADISAPRTTAGTSSQRPAGQRRAEGDGAADEDHRLRQREHEQRRQQPDEDLGVAQLAAAQPLEHELALARRQRRRGGRVDAEQQHQGELHRDDVAPAPSSPLGGHEERRSRAAAAARIEPTSLLRSRMRASERARVRTRFMRPPPGRRLQGSRRGRSGAPTCSRCAVRPRQQRAPGRLAARGSRARCSPSRPFDAQRGQFGRERHIGRAERDPRRQAGGDLAERPVDGERAVAHDRHTVGERLRLLEVVGGEQHRRAAPPPVRRSTSQVRRRDSGSSPVVGSSSRRSSGSPWIASATSRRRCSPPESCSTRTSALRARSSRSRSARTSPRRLPSAAHSSAVSRTVSSPEKPPLWSMIPIRGRTAARSRSGSCPSTRVRPPNGV